MAAVTAGEQVARIRAIAGRLFAQQGYDATGIQQLGEEIGLGRGALYHHIGSKQQLLFDVVSGPLFAAVEEAERVAAEPLDPEQKIRRLSRVLLNAISADLDAWTVFFRDGTSLEGPLRERVVAWRDRFEATWVAAVREGVSAGVFRELDPIAIKGILGMHNYAYVWLRPGGRLDSDAIAAVFSDIVIGGLTGGNRS